MLTSFAHKIRRSFSAAAHDYDRLTDLHKSIGQQLVDRLSLRKNAHVVDVGCGTGWLTARLQGRHPALVVGLDISPAMLGQAQQRYFAGHWLQADAHQLPLKSDSVDNIVSNLAYQWMEDLTGAFRQARRVLKEEGALNVALFGRHTCHELFTCLRQAAPQARYRRLWACSDVRLALEQAGFKAVKVESTVEKMEFKDALELLAWLKQIGANGLGEKVFLGKQSLGRLMQTYRQQFSCNEGVAASFEIIWAYGQK